MRSLTCCNFRFACFANSDISRLLQEKEEKILQGSYRQDCVKFKDFSRTSKKTFLLFSRTENLRKMLIYTLNFYFGNASP